MKDWVEDPCPIERDIVGYVYFFKISNGIKHFNLADNISQHTTISLSLRYKYLGITYRTARYSNSIPLLCITNMNYFDDCNITCLMKFFSTSTSRVTPFRYRASLSIAPK